MLFAYTLTLLITAPQESSGPTSSAPMERMPAH